jgi:hypothetical protein
VAALQVVDADVLTAALRTLAGASWPIPVDEVPGLVASLGWAVVPGTEGRSLQADTGWPLSSAAANFTSDKLGLATVSFAVTDDLLDASPWRGRLLRDAFTTVVAVATPEVGEPTGRVAGATPQVWWDLPNGGRIEIAVADTSVMVGAYSSEYADDVRRLES